MGGAGGGAERERERERERAGEGGGRGQVLITDLVTKVVTGTVLCLPPPPPTRQPPTHPALFCFKEVASA